MRVRREFGSGCVDVVAFRETVERLARNEFLGNLPFEFDAAGTVLGHALQKSGLGRQIWST
jgi:hypothetical protein